MRNYFKQLGLSLWLGLFLCGLLLTSTAVPALSNTEISNRGYELLTAGQRQLQQGQASEAIRHWQAAEQYYRERNNTRELLYSQLLQTEALRHLGLYPQACGLLVQIIDFQTASEPEPFLPQALCQNQEITRNLLLNTGDNFQQQPDQFKAATLRSLGVVLRGLGRLDESEMVLRNKLSENDPATLLSLGNTLRARGNLVRDRITSPNYDAMPWRFEKLDVLADEESEDIRKAFDDVKSLYQQADGKYQQVIDVNGSLEHSFSQKAQLNRLDLALELAHLFDSETDKTWQRNAQEIARFIDLNPLPMGQERVLLKLNLAKRLAFLNADAAFNTNWYQVETLLDNAEAEANALGNAYAESYVLGSKGGLYEYFASLDGQSLVQARHWRNRSIELTQEALKLVQPGDVPEMAYQWQWQLGRLSKATLYESGADAFTQDKTSQRKVTIGYYEDAVQTLESVRSNLLSVNSDVQFSFRDNVEPIYRELVDLLLPVYPQENKLGSKSQESLEGAANYLRARELINELQLAELENFLQCNWQSRERKTLDELTLEKDSNAISIYPILLKDRLEILVSLPEQSSNLAKSADPWQMTIKRLTPTPIDAGSFEKKVNSFRYKTIYYNPYAEEEVVKEWKNTSNSFYQLLIKPIEDDIDISLGNEQTLVFVLDGVLRNLPLAALYNDQDKYLIENYAVALSVGLELPSSSNPKNIHALLSNQPEKTPDFASGLPLSDKEIEEIIAVLDQTQDTEYDFLPGKKLGKESLRESLDANPYNVVHLSVHGKFSSNPDETFLALSPDEKLTLREINQFFKPSSKDPIELLVMSSCQTAEGDNRALLGLAGITIQTGVRSAIGGSWTLQDRETREIMSVFYKELADSRDISQALRTAQLKFVYSGNKVKMNPGLWAPYILVGNWKSL